MPGRLYILGTCLALLGAVVVIEVALTRPAAELPGKTPGAAADPAPAAPLAEGPNLDRLLDETLARPLFSPSRRPAAEAAAGGSSDTDLDNIRLTAIMIEPNRRLAIFAVADGKPLELGEGDMLNGRRISAISLNEVSLVGPAGTETLQPKAAPAPPAGTSLPVSAPASAAAEPRPLRTVTPAIQPPVRPVRPVPRPRH